MLRHLRRRGISICLGARRHPPQCARGHHDDAYGANDTWKGATARTTQGRAEMAILRQAAARYLFLASQPAKLPGVDKYIGGVHRAVRAATAAAVAIHLAPGGAYELESHFAAQTTAPSHLGSHPHRDSARRHSNFLVHSEFRPNEAMTLRLDAELSVQVPRRAEGDSGVGLDHRHYRAALVAKRAFAIRGRLIGG